MRFQVQYFQAYIISQRAAFQFQLAYIQGGNFSFQSAENGELQPEGGRGPTVRNSLPILHKPFPKVGGGSNTIGRNTLQ